MKYAIINCSSCERKIKIPTTVDRAICCYCGGVTFSGEERMDDRTHAYKCTDCGRTTSAKGEITRCPHCNSKDKLDLSFRGSTQVGGTHYGTLQPWDLQRVMKSWGNLFVDARRCDVMKYIFRKKSDPLEDLKKARHCLDAAIAEMEKSLQAKE